MPPYRFACRRRPRAVFRPGCRTYSMNRPGCARCPSPDRPSSATGRAGGQEGGQAWKRRRRCGGGCRTLRRIRLRGGRRIAAGGPPGQFVHPPRQVLGFPGAMPPDLLGDFGPQLGGEFRALLQQLLVFRPQPLGLGLDLLQLDGERADGVSRGLGGAAVAFAPEKSIF